MRRLPTKAELDEKFAYDPKAGDLIWRVSCGRAKAGDVAGYLQANGYRYVGSVVPRTSGHLPHGDRP